MKTIAIDLTSIYNDLQARKHRCSSMNQANTTEASHDRLVVHADIDGDTIKVKGYGFNTLIIQVPDAYAMDYSIRGYIYNGTGPAIIFNGKSFPIEVPLVEGDTVGINVTMPSFSAFPMPDKFTVELMSNDVAQATLKADLVEKHPGIIKELAISRGFISASTNGQNMILSSDAVKEGITVYTAAAIVAGYNHMYGKDGGTGVVDRTRNLLNISLAQGVLQQSGDQKVMTVYPGEGGWGHRTTKVLDDCAIGESRSVFKTVLGKPDFCTE